jgi:rubrerythrin
MKTNCVHSCKGLCAALDAAVIREQEAIKEYKSISAECDYPDVKILLNALLADREKSLKLLREKAEMLRVKFDTLDQISDGFESA